MFVREKVDHRHPTVIHPRHIGDVRKVRHEQVVKDIVRARFSFPNDEYPAFRTHLNVPEHTFAVQGRDGRLLYPDIVVVEFPHTLLQMTAKVEMEDTATQRESVHQWVAYSQLSAPFYLYVPFEVVNDVRQLLREWRVKVAGLRGWRYLVGYKTLEVVDVYTRTDPIAALLPRFLVPKGVRRRLYID